jgi:hypothetical protein
LWSLLKDNAWFRKVCRKLETTSFSKTERSPEIDRKQLQWWCHLCLLSRDLHLKKKWYSFIPKGYWKKKHLIPPLLWDGTAKRIHFRFVSFSLFRSGFSLPFLLHIPFVSV